MRLLADECCSKPVVDALRASGHDVRHVLEFDPGAADRTVAATAVSEDRVIVTEDHDSGELAVRERLPMPGGSSSCISAAKRSTSNPRASWKSSVAKVRARSRLLTG